MNKRLPSLALPALLVTLAACGPSPEKAGDPCDPDDGCPGSLVCAPGGEDHICQIPAGGSCQLGSPDLCVGDGVCVDDGAGAGVCRREIGEAGACVPGSSDEVCKAGLVCAEVASGGSRCYAPTFVRGKVFDAQSLAAVEGAHVIALDDQSSAISDVAVSDAAGEYELEVPLPRDDEGAPAADAVFTLRASAQDYQTFPGGLRTALPVDAKSATSAAEGWVIESALTGVALIALAKDEQGRPSISGEVLAGDASGGVLVVAEGTPALAALSDKSGAYTIFNVADGDYQVKGYAAGVQLAPQAVSVKGEALAGIDLPSSGEALGSVQGSINIVNADGSALSSVVLVVESTFSDTFVRGEVPRGLRAPLSGPPSIKGMFTIQGVPAGKYVVLAAFENDGLVRDPDPNIAGTQIVTVTMPSPGTTVGSSDFKVTEALAVVSPGKDDPELVSGKPTLRWADDSSEELYTVVVYNAYGERVWCLADASILEGCDGGNVPSVSGGGDVEVAYTGPLEPGMYYQFRATSWKSAGKKDPGPISTTEDLRGVFYTAGE